MPWFITGTQFSVFKNKNADGKCQSPTCYEWIVPFSGVEETFALLGVACWGVGGAEIDGTTGVGERRLWLTGYGDLVIESLPVREDNTCQSC